jgi:hypothetical protein
MFVLYRKKIDTIYIFYINLKSIKKPRGINRAVLGGKNYPLGTYNSSVLFGDKLNIEVFLLN